MIGANKFWLNINFQPYQEISWVSGLKLSALLQRFLYTNLMFGFFIGSFMPSRHCPPLSALQAEHFATLITALTQRSRPEQPLAWNLRGDGDDVRQHPPLLALSTHRQLESAGGWKGICARAGCALLSISSAGSQQPQVWLTQSRLASLDKMT